MRNNFNYNERKPSSRSRNNVFGRLAAIPGIALIYTSALACTRHRCDELVALQKQGALSFLLFDEIDMITGDYLEKTRKAAAVIASECSPSGIILMTGCQGALLSTDYNLLCEEIEGELGVPIRVHDGCRLCANGGDDAGEAPGGKINQLMYEFIRRSERSPEPSVNLIGSDELSGDNELFAVLRAAGVKKINRISECKTQKEYQALGTAHLNIIVSAQDADIGPRLEETLGIPWICLGGIYDPAELEKTYKKLGEIFAAPIDVSGLKDAVQEKLLWVKGRVGSRAISIESDAGLAKWLLTEGFTVESLSMGHRESLTREQRDWFKENVPDFKIITSGRGRAGKPNKGRGGDFNGSGRGFTGHGGGGSSGREGHAHGGGRGREAASGSSQALIGYAGSMRALERLGDKAEGFSGGGYGGRRQ